MALSTLQTIRNEVRRIVRAPSVQQLSDAELDQNINTFIEKDLPTNLKLFSLRTVFTFYTQPGQDVYETTFTNPNDPFYDFRNKYTVCHQPCYIAGVAAFWTELRSIFFGNWPQTNTVFNTQYVGTGGPGPFVGVLMASTQTQPPPFGTTYFIQKKSVMFNCLDTNFQAMILVDYPFNNQIGYLGIPNVPATPLSNNGFVNYQTGQYSVTFPANTLLSSTQNPNPVWAEFIAVAPGLPTSILYYQNTFTLRPVPDKSYIVQVEADIRPTQLLQAGDVPEISQWWTYIAYGTARRIFVSRSDFNSLNAINPIYKEEEGKVLSTSMCAYANQRTATIYTYNGGVWPTGWNNNTGAGWPF